LLLSAKEALWLQGRGRASAGGWGRIEVLFVTPIPSLRARRSAVLAVRGQGNRMVSRDEETLTSLVRAVVVRILGAFAFSLLLYPSGPDP